MPIYAAPNGFAATEQDKDEYKKSLGLLEGQLSDAQLDYEIALAYTKQYDYANNQKLARLDSQIKGETGLEWYDRVSAEFEDAKKVKADLEAQLAGIRKERVYGVSKWDSGVYLGEDPERVAYYDEKEEELEKQLAKATEAYIEARYMAGYAYDYRYADVDRSEEAVAFGKARSERFNTAEAEAESDYYTEAVKKYYGISDEEWAAKDAQEQERADHCRYRGEHA